jgi:hypothetical protein
MAKNSLQLFVAVNERGQRRLKEIMTPVLRQLHQFHASQVISGKIMPKPGLNCLDVGGNSLHLNVCLHRRISYVKKMQVGSAVTSVIEMELNVLEHSALEVLLQLLSDPQNGVLVLSTNSSVNLPHSAEGKAVRLSNPQ